jgi:hypothetical protein
MAAIGLARVDHGGVWLPTFSVDNFVENIPCKCSKAKLAAVCDTLMTI